MEENAGPLYWPNLPKFIDRQELLRRERGKHWQTIARAVRNVADAKTELYSLTRGRVGIFEDPPWKKRLIDTAVDKIGMAEERLEIAEHESRIIPRKIIPFTIEVLCKIKKGVIEERPVEPGHEMSYNYRYDEEWTITGVDENDPGFYVGVRHWREPLVPDLTISPTFKVRIEHTVVSDREMQRINRAMARLGVSSVWRE
jgi:hypothetical protein